MKTAILVVDDDESIREMMDVILTQAGYQVALAPNGEAALDVLKRSRFALVLLDVHMPRTSGLQVLAAMKRLRHRPPVLMVTADSQIDTVREALSLGCAGYIAKPFKPEALLERVRRALADPAAPLLV